MLPTAVRRLAAAPLVVVLCLCVASPALAVDVYLNNVRVTALTGVTISGATVRFDSRGDVYITAPGYSVSTVDDGQTTPPRTDAGPASPHDTGSRPSPDTRAVPSAITRHYFLATETNAPGMVQYRIEVYVNGELFRTIPPSGPAIVEDLTRRLRPGPNEIHLVARKVTTGGRRSTSASHWFRVIIGEGHAQGDTAVIDTPLVRFQRGADESRTVEQTFSVFAR